jgi:hypothetical protein
VLLLPKEKREKYKSNGASDVKERDTNEFERLL